MIALARTCLSVLCCLALPALAQDASVQIDQQSSSQSTLATQTTDTRWTTSGSVGTGSDASSQDSTASANVGSITTQTRSSGSSQSESRERSTDVGIDLGGADRRDDDWGSDRRRGTVREGDLFGSWTLGQESGNSCTIQLKDSTWFGGYGAWVPAGCPDGFFSANRWLLSGNQLLLTDTDNTVLGRFHPSGGGRWTGRRESDGARLYLNPQGR